MVLGARAAAVRACFHFGPGYVQFYSFTATMFRSAFFRAAAAGARQYTTAAGAKPASNVSRRIIAAGVLGGAAILAANNQTAVAHADVPDFLAPMLPEFVVSMFASKNIEDVKKAIAATLEDPAWDDGSWGPTYVRLAWHLSGTFDKKDGSGGSAGGRIRHSPEAAWGANKGLQHARARLESVKAKYPWMSYADLYTLAGAVAVEAMGGPAIPWRQGRSDDADGSRSPPDGRLPDASKEQSHVRQIFYRMGFNDREIVALLGAHSLGRCHVENSGYTGPWTRAPTTFSNEYYKELLKQKWQKKKWGGPLQYEDKATGDLMMTPADLALINDKEFKKFVDLYAKDEKVFFADFAAAFAKLLELGVAFPEVKA
eukprot:tig00020685_g12929.t1